MSTDLKTFYENEVPAQNSTDNDWFVDVIGQKNDGHSGDSIYSVLRELEEHVHSVDQCYPTLAAPITLTSGVGAWTLGNFVEIVPANTITDDFDIHWVTISSPDTNEDYEIHLYYGAGDTLCARIPFSRSNNFVNSIQIGIMTPLIPANSRIRAKMAGGTGGETAEIKINYHEY